MAGKAEVWRLQLLFGSELVMLLQLPCELAKGKVSKMLCESALLVV